jgi:hypothetical protein
MLLVRIARLMIFEKCEKSIFSNVVWMIIKNGDGGDE